MARTIRIVDTTLRDGHQCLWATRMPTAMMLPVAEAFDRSGFWAVEMIGAEHSPGFELTTNHWRWVAASSLCIALIVGTTLTAVEGRLEPARPLLARALPLALAAEIQDHVKTVTAPYKYPRQIEFAKELPKTVSGKIQRGVLRRVEKVGRS